MTKSNIFKDHKYTVEQLKKARLEAGLDQADVAKLPPVKLSLTFQKIEAGQRRDLILRNLRNFQK